MTTKDENDSTPRFPVVEPKNKPSVAPPEAKSTAVDSSAPVNAPAPATADVKSTSVDSATPAVDEGKAAVPKAAPGASAANAKAAKAARKAASAVPPAEPVLVRGWLAPLGAVISGCLYFVSFAGFDVWPLGFVALVPWYIVLVGQTPKRAAWLSLLTGFAMCMGGFYWLANMLNTFSGFSLPLCLFFTSFICVYQAGRLVLTGWLYARAAARGWPGPLVFAGAFAASELVFPLLFPWYFAAAVHKVPVLMQLADIGGPILVSLVLVAINLAIAEPLRAKLAGRIAVERGPSSEAKIAFPLDKRVVGAGVITLLVALLYGAIRISMTNARVEHAESARVGYVQGNMGLMAKRENPGEGLRRHKSLTAELKAKGVDLVVWSETSATFPTREDLADEKSNFYKDRFTASLGVPTIFGAVLYRVDPGGDPALEKWFNTALASDEKGVIRGRYDKQFLLAFGEYLPLGETFPILHKWSPHSGRFSPGTSLEPLKLEVKGKEHPISVLICYEDVLPGFTNREVSHANPDLLVNMTNDAWFGDTTEPWEHLALAQFRAVEHRRYLVRSTNSGVSAVIDPNGSVVAETVSTPFKAEAKDTVIHWLNGGTIYEIIGDAPWYLVTLLIAVAAFKKRPPRTAPVAA